VTGDLVSPADAAIAMQEEVHRKRRRILILLFFSLIVFFAGSLFLGRFPAFRFLVGAHSDADADALAWRLIWNLRLPRCIVAVAAGMALASAGMVFQTIFANPLVEPGLLSVSQGAAFGAAFSIVAISGSAWIVQSSAALCAFAGLGASYLLARSIRYGGWVLRLILAGIAVSAMFSAGLGILKYLADPLKELPEITFWLLGSLAGMSWTETLSILPAVALGMAYMLAMRWRINVLSLSDEAAHALGVSVQRERVLLLVAAVVPTAAVISAAGMIGWVGLMVPHIGRRMFGADTRFALPATILLGGLFTLFCDDLARMLLPGEIPLGILTSFAGALVFLILISSKGVRWQR
jgi:iron complex transport system permease protein